MFLAGKVEETPKSLGDLLKVSTAVKHKDEDGTACSLMQDSVRWADCCTVTEYLIALSRISSRSKEN